MLVVFCLSLFLMIGCGSQKPDRDREATEPVELQAYHGAQKAQRDVNKREKERQTIDQESQDQKPAPKGPDGGFGTIDGARDVKQQSNDQAKEAEQAQQDTNQ